MWCDTAVRKRDDSGISDRDNKSVLVGRRPRQIRGLI